MSRAQLFALGNVCLYATRVYIGELVYLIHPVCTRPHTQLYRLKPFKTLNWTLQGCVLTLQHHYVLLHKEQIKFKLSKQSLTLIGA